MPSLALFNDTGIWIRGNLHCHTTESDGEKSIMDVIQWYRDREYGFLSITDHNVLTLPDYPNDSTFSILPGIELNCREDRKDMHILGFGLDKIPIEPFSKPQETIDAIHAAGGLSVIAHPYWHDLTVEDLQSLHGYTGIEIFNTSCWVEIQKGHSLVHWDGTLRRGARPWGLATDDAHWKYPDYGGGWVMLKAEKNDPLSILDAIRKGSFYSSTGPEIFDIQFDAGTVTVKCSPVRSIYVIGPIYYCPNAVNAWDGVSDQLGCSQLLDPRITNKTITEARFNLDPRQNYFRVEVVDFYGRSAWSNPYFPDSDPTIP